MFWLGFGFVGWVFFAASRGKMAFLLNIHRNELVTEQAIDNIKRLFPSGATSPAAGYFGLTARDFSALSPLPHSHVNPYGTFDLDMDSRLPLDDFPIAA